MLPIGLCNPVVRLGATSPLINNYFFCVVDVIIVPLPVWILFGIGVPFLFWSNRRPNVFTFSPRHSSKTIQILAVVHFILILLMTFWNWWSFQKLISSSSGMGLLLANTFGILLAIILDIVRNRRPLRAREISIMLRIYWSSLWVFFILKARMLVYVNSANYATGYFGPSTYPNTINERDSYIIAGTAFLLSIFETITTPTLNIPVVIQEGQVGVGVGWVLPERSLPPLPRESEGA